MSAKSPDLPHSWAIDNWPVGVYPNNATKARYLVRTHRKELLLFGALSRVGRNLIVLGTGYNKWLEKKASRVTDFPIAPNRQDSGA